MKKKIIYIANEKSHNIWHKRLGHVNRNSLKILGLPYNDKICQGLVESKSTPKPFNKCIKKSVEIGELIYFDITGAVATSTHEGHNYFEVLIDDFSHFLIVKLLKNKSEPEQNLIDFIQLSKTLHGKRTKRVRLDNGGEFKSNHFKNFCRSEGIRIEYNGTYSTRKRYFRKTEQDCLRQSENKIRRHQPTKRTMG